MKKFLVTLGAGALPFVALAQDATNGPDIVYIESLLDSVSAIFDIIVPILVAFAAIYFIWNVIFYVVAANEEAKAQAKTRVGYGLFGLVIIFALWGLVSILVSIFGVSTGGAAPETPSLPQPSTTTE